MKIFVTGGAGFIGRHLVEALVAQGHEVRVLTRSPEKFRARPNISMVRGDLVRNLDFEVGVVDVLFHCAGEINDPSKMRALHVTGTLNLLKKVKKGTRWVQLSSVGVYGKAKENPVVESTPFAPEGEYEVTKAESEQLAQAFCRESGIDYTIVRPSVVFGKDMTNQSIIQLIRMIRRGTFAYFCDPSLVVLNYIHVDDVAKGLIECGFSDIAIGQDYILNDPTNLKTLVEMVRGSSDFFRLPKSPTLLLTKTLEALGVKAPLTSSRVEALTNRTVYSMDKLRNDLDFECLTGVDQGLEEMIATY